MSKLTLMIHIDALRHDYITKEDMPFLYSLGEKGIKTRVVPPFGFEPDKAYLTGTYPAVNEGGVHFIYNDGQSGIPFGSFMPAILDTLNIYVQYPIRRIVQYLISKKAKTSRIRKNPFIGFIPFGMLKYFDFCDYLSPHKPGFCSRAQTIYDYLRKANLKFLYHGYPENKCGAEDVRYDILNKHNEPVPFIFLLIGDLDVVGHNDGPNSIQRRKVSSKVDNALRDIYKHLANLYDEVDLIAFGDHGMAEVRDSIDFSPVIADLPLKRGVDYIYFLDSTFARFWYFNDSAKDALFAALSKIKGGKLINGDEKKDYKIRIENRKVGDLIFWVDEGTMIFPNFWHVRKIKKGMHGYRKEVMDNHGAFIFYSSNKLIREEVEPIEMVDVFQTVMYSIFSEPVKVKNVFGMPVQIMTNVDSVQ